MTRSVNLPGGRADVRDRATTVAMHLLRRALLQAHGRDRACARRRATRGASIARAMSAPSHSAAVRGGRPAGAGARAAGRVGARWRPPRWRAPAGRSARAPAGRRGAAPDAVLPRQPAGRGDRRLAAALGGVRAPRAASCRSARRCGCRRGARARWRWRSTTATGELAALHAAVCERAGRGDRLGARAPALQGAPDGRAAAAAARSTRARPASEPHALPPTPQLSLRAHRGGPVSLVAGAVGGQLRGAGARSGPVRRLRILRLTVERGGSAADPACA